MDTKTNLIPTKIEMTFYGVVALLIVIVGNIKFLTDSVLGGTYASYDDVKTLLDAQVQDRLVTLDNLSWAPDLAVFAVWALAGAIIYSIGQAAYLKYREVKEDVEISTNYVHPLSFASTKFWLHIILVSLLRFVLLMMIFAVSFLIFGVLTPSIGEIIKSFESTVSFFAVLALISGLLVMFLAVLTEAIFIKLLLNSRHYS